MLSTNTQGIIIFIFGVSILLSVLIGFIVTILYKYQQKQNRYFKEIEEIKTKYESSLLRSQLEIQEQTFQNISREIHDNIGQKLTLAKLNLNTTKQADGMLNQEKVDNAIAMIGESIADLSDMSRSMSPELILSQGLIKAIEFEVTQLKKSGIYDASFLISGDSTFLDASRELIIFRIVQEALNNIIKHAEANKIMISLQYNKYSLVLEISDNGKGFLPDNQRYGGTGIMNMQKRASMLNGSLSIKSRSVRGTSLKIKIPVDGTKS